MKTLELQGVKVYIQDFGTSLGVFLSGDKQAIEERFNSFYNHGATSGTLDYWTDNLALFYIPDNARIKAEDRLQRAMEQGALAEILNSHVSTKGSNPINQAREIANARVEQIQFVHWYHSSANLDLYSMGDSVKAEKATGDFTDVTGAIIECTAGHKGVSPLEGEAEFDELEA